MQRLDDLLAHRLQRLTLRFGAVGFLDGLQAEQDRGQLLAGLVVEFTGQAPPFKLLSLDDTAQGLLSDAA